MYKHMRSYCKLVCTHGHLPHTQVAVVEQDRKIPARTSVCYASRVMTGGSRRTQRPRKIPSGYGSIGIASLLRCITVVVVSSCGPSFPAWTVSPAHVAALYK